MNHLAACAAIFMGMAVLAFSDQTHSAASVLQSVIINNQGKTIGRMAIRPAGDSVLFEIKIRSLPPGKHGMHLHAVGDCSDVARFKLSGGHVVSGRGRQHGFMNPRGPHAGDLPNLIITASGITASGVAGGGAAHIEIYSSVSFAALLDEDGSALVIHAQPDDHRSQPIGGAGARIACAEIK